jgi:beta-lactamase class D
MQDLKHYCCAGLLLLVIGVSQAANAQWQQRPDWAEIFAAAGVDGTLAVLDQRGGADRHLTHNLERAERRYTPASTFKLPHALFALDAGVVRDEFQVLAWDGEKRFLEAWNRDQDLRSSMRNSVVWVYQGFARTIGVQRERNYLESIDYGNADPSGGVDRFWLDGALKISALEQISFLTRLYRNELPFKIEHQRLARIFHEGGQLLIIFHGQTR